MNMQWMLDEMLTPPPQLPVFKTNMTTEERDEYNAKVRACLDHTIESIKEFNKIASIINKSLDLGGD